jgi:polyhydroxyalkanoate synthase
MSQESNPFDKLMRLWTSGTRTWFEADRLFRSALTRLTSGLEQSSKESDPQEAVKQQLDNWAQVLSKLAELQPEMLKRSMAQLSELDRKELGGETLAQLNQLIQANWMKQTQAFFDLLPEVTTRIQAADPERMSKLFESMMTEYLADMQDLDGDAFYVDLKPLADAWQKVLSGSPDDSSQKIVDRFSEAISVKSRYGSEYYADPEKIPVGQTPCKCIHQEGALRLFHYPSANTGNHTPVLLVYSIINRPYILDLLPEHSFIQHLLSQGLDVYLVDWGEPTPGDPDATLDNYIDPLLSNCVEVICRRTGYGKVSMFGHCIGGNLALMYAALFPDKVERLITLTTPVSTTLGGVVALWTDRDVFPIDDVIDSYGIMPAKLIRYTFLAIKPYFEVLKMKKFLENLGNDRAMTLFYAIDRWANENVDIAGEVFRKFIKEVFHQERFSKSQTEIHGRKVKLENITCPLMNLAANEDWIVPMENSRILGELVGSKNQQFVEIDGSHVAIMIDPGAVPVWKKMSDFLKD